MDNYTSKIINYLNNPQFQKKLERQTHTLELKSSVCGDPLRINLNLENDIVHDISYSFNGCGLNVAVTEIVCKYLLGKSILKIESLSIEKLKEELEFPNQKIHCVELVLETFSELLKTIKNN